MHSEKKPERTSRLQIAFLLLVVLAFAAFLFIKPGGTGIVPPQPPAAEQAIDMDQFQATVLGSPRIIVVMDLRDSPTQNSSNTIMQCGVNLAFSLSQLNKTIESYAYDKAGLCYSSAGVNESVAGCERAMGRGYRFLIGYGPGSTTMYGNRTIILTNEYFGSSCSIGIEQTVEPEPPWKLVDPNATAKTANMSFDEIFSGCLARDVCTANKTADEADSCLRGYALTIGGDAHCCFGLSTNESMNACILATAGQSHGIKADYCQFLPLPQRDECYFEYGTNYLYFAYCDRIMNSSMKSDCLIELSKANALPSQIAKNGG